MKQYEVTFNSVNTTAWSKPITLLVIAPETITENTGAMLFNHGWSGNRFQNQEQMEFTADQFDLVCVSAEYRQSGYDFDPVVGRGAYAPYDTSHLQVYRSGRRRFAAEV